MRPRGYRVTDYNTWYDPRDARRITFEHFLRVADEIAKERDRAEKYFERAEDRIREGVPQARASYWRRRLSSTRAALAEQNAFWREIDEQLSRETPAEKKRREKQEREEEKRRKDEEERKRRDVVDQEPRAVEFELSLEYSAKLGAARGSEVDITVRFWRQDKDPMTMAEAWRAVNTYRASGEFPSEIEVAAIDWLGIAAKRRGQPKTSMLGPSAQVDTALSDFFGILHSVPRNELQLDFFPVRLGSVKQDG